MKPTGKAAMREGSQPAPKSNKYYAFTDASGGSSDAFTVGIAHADGELSILDCIREIKPPFSPQAVVAEFATLLASYGCFEVTGDRFSGQFVQELFRNAGVAYNELKRSKSEIYLDLLPMLNSGRVALLDHPKLVAQLVGLERRAGQNKDVIDHAPHGGHDDLINAAAGALTLAALVAAPMPHHPPITGLGRAAFYSSASSAILADRSSGLPGVVASVAYADGDVTAKPGGASFADTTQMFFMSDALPLGHWTPNSAKIWAARAAAAAQPPPPPRISVECIHSDGLAADGPLTAKAGASNFRRLPELESFSEFRERITAELKRSHGRDAIVIWPELVT